MIRTQIILDKQLKQKLQRFSEQQGMSLSGLIRLGMTDYLKNTAEPNRGFGALKRMSGRIKKGEGGPKNLSEQIDEILYSL